MWLKDPTIIVGVVTTIWLRDPSPRHNGRWIVMSDGSPFDTSGTDDVGSCGCQIGMYGNVRDDNILCMMIGM
jgi:hypothetical protein